MVTIPFAPAFGSNQVLTVTSTSANAAINANSAQMRVTNTGTNLGYFRTYNSATYTGTGNAATVADFCVPAGSSATITKSQDHDRIAYISASGTTFQVIMGVGL